MGRQDHVHYGVNRLGMPSCTLCGQRNDMDGHKIQEDAPQQETVRLRCSVPWARSLTQQRRRSGYRHAPRSVNTRPLVLRQEGSANQSFMR